MNQPLGVALLSFAHNHQFHWAKAFASDATVRIVTAWDDDQKRGQAGASQVKAEFSEDLQDVLANPAIDAVAICSETSLHAQLAIAAARRGKHVLCEKPMALSLKECSQMIRAAEEAGVTFMQAFPQRHFTANQKIKAMLDAKAIGKVSLVRKRHGHWFGLEGLENTMPWIVHKELAGEGGFFDEGIHECDVLRWFFGDPVSVTAMVGNSSDTIAQFGVDDFGAALFRFAQGEIASLEAGWTWLAGGPTTEIYGDAGTIMQNFSDLASNAAPVGQFPHLQIFHREGTARQWRELPEKDSFALAHQSVAKAFVHCLRNGEPPPVTGEDGMKALEMMIGAYQAARTGKTVEFL